MEPKRLVAFRSWLALAAVVLVAMLAGIAWYASPTASPSQPVQFAHRSHVRLTACIFCHPFYETREVAGRPALSRCMLCHAYPLTDKPEAARLVQLSKSSPQLAWVRLTRLPRHVRFSHRRHVALARIPCADCHGPIADLAQPPARPLVPIVMNTCIECHQARAFRWDERLARNLKAVSLHPELIAELQDSRRKRFPTRAAAVEFAQAVSPAPLTESQRAELMMLTVSAEPVTTDCIACHR